MDDEVYAATIGGDRAAVSGFFQAFYRGIGYNAQMHEKAGQKPYFSGVVPFISAVTEVQETDFDAQEIMHKATEGLSETERKGCEKIKANLVKNVQVQVGSAVKQSIGKKNERTVSHTKGGKFSHV